MVRRPTTGEAPALTPAMFEALQKLSESLLGASQRLGAAEARYIVDLYYQVQDFRKRAANQVRAYEGSGEPNQLLLWVDENFRRMEANIKRGLDEFTGAYTVGRWMKSITGVAEVISAGLMAHIDIRKAPTVGHIWRFAGLDPSRIWWGKVKAEEIVRRCAPAAKPKTKLGMTELQAVAQEAQWTLREIQGKLGAQPTREQLQKLLARCPWNADLKCLCFKIGDCFCKFCNHKDEYYGTIYRQRKEKELAANEAGRFADQAAHSLATKNYGEETDARKWYEQGKLPPARLHMRATRFAVKTFLSHLHHVMYRDYYGSDPVIPYALDPERLPGLDHRHFIPIPNWPFADQGKNIRELLEGAGPLPKGAPTSGPIQPTDK